MNGDKQENNEKLSDISLLSEHKSDKEYMKRIERVYENIIEKNKSSTILRNYQNRELWEARRIVSNNKIISAFGKTKKEAVEKLMRKYEDYLERLKFIEKAKQEELKNQNEIESQEME